MQRWLTIILGLGVIALVVAITAKSTPLAPISEAASDAGADGASASNGNAADAGAALTANAPPDAGSLLEAPSEPPMPIEGGAPTGSPRQVRFGVVLVQYDGAEAAPGSPPPPHVRSRNEAVAIADKLATEAKSDFHAAVQHGDPGSAEDVGFVHRGVLEPGPEYVLFTLPVGGVSGAIDTPRGFWIVKRLE